MSHPTMSKKVEMRLGLDFGGVIIRSSTISRGDRTLFDEPGDPIDHAHPGMLPAVASLAAHTEGRVWIVSKARPAMQPVITRYLAEIEFHERTGVPRSQVHFVTEREGKRAVCRAHGITHFVDDRVALMEILTGVVPHLFLLAPPERRAGCPTGVTIVDDWTALLAELGSPPLPGTRELPSSP